MVTISKSSFLSAFYFSNFSSFYFLFTTNLSNFASNVWRRGETGLTWAKYKSYSLFCLYRFGEVEFIIVELALECDLYFSELLESAANDDFKDFPVLLCSLILTFFFGYSVYVAEVVLADLLGEPFKFLFNSSAVSFIWSPIIPFIESFNFFFKKGWSLEMSWVA